MRPLKYSNHTLVVSSAGSSLFLRYRRILLYIISILPSRRLFIREEGKENGRESEREGRRKGRRADCPRQHLNDVETRARRFRPICVAVSRQSRDFVNYEILRFKRAPYQNFRRSSVRQLSHVPRRCSSCLKRVYAQTPKFFIRVGNINIQKPVKCHVQFARLCVCMCGGGRCARVRKVVY